MKKLLFVSACALALTSSPALAAGFVNGGFEDGTTNGWIIGGGSRSSQNLEDIVPSEYLPGGARYSAGIAAHSAVVNPGLAEGALGALMPNVVYSGGKSLRVEDTTTGGYLSVASQTVANYTEKNIFFAWLAVLENGGHSAPQSAAMIITLEDLTKGDVVISRIYNAVANGGGVDSTRFDQLGNYFYTPAWQIEQLAIGDDRSGNTFRLTVLASDCAPTAHEGYVYLDGFGAVTPPPVIDPPVDGVPEPATWAMMISGFALIGASMRRRKVAVSFA
jgi:hypothetical protein